MHAEQTPGVLFSLVSCRLQVRCDVSGGPCPERSQM